MTEIILQKLNDIEARENVRILHAVESGSRAWGFASPDSDYDVRFFYICDLRHYLKLEKTRDVIEWQLDKTLDINGWDLQKALRLLRTSNPTLFEWSNSPIIYKTTDDWDKIKAEINDYFSSKSGLYHYLSTAAGNYREFLKGDIVKLKKYFYVIRPLLACKWILDKRCPPPMLFTELADEVLEAEMKDIITELLAQKKITSEMGEGKRIEILNNYIEKNLVSLKETIDTLPDDHNGDWQRLNELFLMMFKELKT